MRIMWSALVVALAMTASSFAQVPLPEVPESLKQELVGYLTEHWMSPEEYVVSKFRDHDIVFIGERHRVKHDVELIQRLIPRLYEAGIHNLGIEFGCYEFQDTVDYLITAPTYDEKLARWLLFKSMTSWGFVEYEDLYRKAWEFNQSLPADAPKFRIVNLCYRIRWDLATERMSEEDRRQVHHRGDYDTHMARVVFDEFAKKGRKALIYSGSHHAFTRYFQSVWDHDTGIFYRLERHRMGNIVHDSIPDRVFLIMLHHPWPPKHNADAWARPVGGVIDAVMQAVGPKPVGFDVLGSPFGALPDTTACYSLGYGDFRLQTFCDGYIYQRPFDEYEGCTVDTLFVTDDNLQEAINFISVPSARSRFKTPTDFIASMRRDTEVKRLIEEGFTSSSVVRTRPPERIPLPEIPEAHKSELVAYLTENWSTPEDYILSKFTDRDIVFLSGYPAIKHDALLVQSLIPRLYAAGIPDLGFAFGAFESQDSVDYLINAPEYNEALAQWIIFQERPYWALVEFQDIYRQAWALNNSLPAGAPRFRIVNLNYRERWDLATENMTSADSQLVWYRGPEGEFMARRILDEFVKKGRKALVFSSSRNAFTRYRWPLLDSKTGGFAGFRPRDMGNIVSDSIPSRVFSINMHWPWMQKTNPGEFSFSYPVGGFIDAVMREFESPRVGFDVVGSPFGTLTDSTAQFTVGYSPFVLADFCDGYIYQKTISEYEACTVDTLFVRSDNFEEARRFFPNVLGRRELRSAIDVLDVARNDLGIRWRWANLR